MDERASDPITRDFTETPTRYLDGGRDALAAAWKHQVVTSGPQLPRR
jgi:hypothetical protein